MNVRDFPTADRIGVLYLNNAPFVGGAQVTLHSIIQRLDRTRFEPYLALPDDRLAVTQFFADLGIPISSVPMYALNPPTWRGSAGLVATCSTLSRLIRRENIRVVHTNTQRGGPYGVALKVLTGTRFVWTINDVGLNWQVRSLMRFPDAITCVSDAVHESVLRSTQRHAHVIKNGVEVEERTAMERLESRKILRHSLSIPDDAFVVGNVARLEPWKGVHVVVDAMRQVLARRPDAWFIHVGDAAPAQVAYAEQLRSACAGMANGHAIMLGFRSDVRRWYDVFDVFAHTPLLLPSGHTEAFGMTVAEAMGYGVPVVAAGVGGLREVVIDGETGTLIPPERPDLLAKAILELAAAPSRRHELGQSGMRRQRLHFSQAREVQAFERLYMDLLTPGGPEESSSGPIEPT